MSGVLRKNEKWKWKIQRSVKGLKGNIWKELNNSRKDSKAQRRQKNPWHLFRFKLCDIYLVPKFDPDCLDCFDAPVIAIAPNPALTRAPNKAVLVSSSVNDLMCSSFN